MPFPVVAIVGRPNVGKSSLFNRLIGRRQAIVVDQPGITRDRTYRDMTWQGQDFTLVDTGGYVSTPEDSLSQSVLESVRSAVEEANLILFVVDGLPGPTSLEYDIAAFLRKSGKQTIMVVNKVDNSERLELVYPFYEFGFDTLLGVSAVHGLGTGDLLDEIVRNLPEQASPTSERAAEKTIRVAIIGRPNVGKSTLLNSLLGKRRAVVDSVPGTTRDPVDIQKMVDGQDFLFVDTAGIRRRGKIEHGAEWLSVLYARRALERCEVALLVLDALEGPVEGDAHVFGLAQESNKACVILANKWDAVEKDETSSGAMAKRIREGVKFLSFAPILTLSALTGQRVGRIYELIRSAHENYHRQVPGDQLKELLESIKITNPPPGKGKKPLLLFRLFQARTAPPTFVLEVSRPEIIHFSYQRFVVNQIRGRFDFSGAPVVLKLRRRARK